MYDLLRNLRWWCCNVIASLVSVRIYWPLGARDVDSGLLHGRSGGGWRAPHDAPPDDELEPPPEVILPDLPSFTMSIYDHTHFFTLLSIAEGITYQISYPDISNIILTLVFFLNFRQLLVFLNMKLKLHLQVIPPLYTTLMFT